MSLKRNKPGSDAESGAASATDPAGALHAAGDWRTEMLSEVRRLIHEAAPDIVEERKWIKPSNPAGVPVWSRAGMVCTGETYKQAVKLTFARGAALPDPQRLFNAGLDGKTRRAIDIREGDVLDAEAFKTLVQVAVAANLRVAAKKSPGPDWMKDPRN